jgi:poly-gamma-glutamate synthesis protein (capsule biosynthesis protein)
MKRKNNRISRLLFWTFFVLIIFSGTLFLRAGKIKHNDTNFQKNSSSVTSSTSSVASVQSSVTSQNAELSFIIAGDAMFDRGVDYRFREDDIFRIFDNIDRNLFVNKDLAILNLEGPISAVPVVKDPNSGLVFNFPPKTVDALKFLGIDGVSLANNHTDNNGLKGYQNTVKVLDEVSIKPFGKQALFDQTGLARFEKNGVKISFISIDVLAVNTDIRPYIIKEKEAGYYVFVMPHWGVEYEKIHHSSQQYLARNWINAGADMIVGGHPHVAQDAEVYKGKPIFYSLGNFVFDQTWSAETQQGVLIEGKIVDGILTITPLPTVSKNVQPELKKGSDKESILAGFRKNFSMSGDLFIFDLTK